MTPHELDEDRYRWGRSRYLTPPPSPRLVPNCDRCGRYVATDRLTFDGIGWTCISCFTEGQKVLQDNRISSRNRVESEAVKVPATAFDNGPGLGRLMRSRRGR